MSNLPDGPLQVEIYDEVLSNLTERYNSQLTQNYLPRLPKAILHHSSFTERFLVRLKHLLRRLTRRTTLHQFLRHNTTLSVMYSHKYTSNQV